MADFELQKSFGIDNAELDGLTPQECFVLGYELAQIDDCLRFREGFEKPVHAANSDRIKQSCRADGRLFLLRWMEGDSSESWMWLKVQKKVKGSD